MILDPVHKLITFEDDDCDKLLLNLINTKEFQRLRRIKQLGMSELVFPGAVHTRFAHSIGVLRFARKFLDRMARLFGERMIPEHKTVVLVASLLHDVGHGPFSHAFEKITGDDHEARTLEIIQDASTEVNRVLSKFDPHLPESLAIFFDKEFKNGEDAAPNAEGAVDASRDKWKIPDYLTQIVTSQLDADRFDYLTRDSYATGTDYGNLDSDWLIEHLYVDEARKRFYVSNKARFAAEAYVYARHHMYQTVYFHKTTRAAEVMLKQVFRRYKELLQGAGGKEGQQAIAPDAPSRVLQAFAGKMSLDQYIGLDDFAVWEFLKATEASPDPILQELGTGLVHRRLFKAADVTEAFTNGDTNVLEFSPKAESIVRKANLDPSYYFVSDTAADTPYKPYNPDAENPAKQIYIEPQFGPPQELSTCSKPVEVLTKKVTLVRYYYPERVRKDLDALVESTLTKGKS